MTAPAESVSPAFDLREPVTLVLSSGREVCVSSWRLMHALDRVDGSLCRVMGLREGERAATASAVAGLNTYLAHFGLRLLRKQEGPAKWVTRYGWAALKETVGMEFEAGNVVVARLAAGHYFGAELSRPVLVANWDGVFASLLGASL